MIIDRETTAIVVDSTADLPDDLINDPSITMVPLTVYFGDEVYLDWVDIRPEEFYARLAVAPELPHTSQPSAGAFLEEYKRLRERYQRVYSVHLSSKLSGTYASAEVARSQIDGVEVVDSELATCGVALLVRRILDFIDKGAPEEEVSAFIEQFKKDKMMLFLPTTLEQLHKGGRIGRAAYLMGGLLNVKPVLGLVDGVVDVHKKVRGVRQALETMRDAVVEKTQPGSTVSVALAHGLDEPTLSEFRTLVEGIADRDIQIRLSTIVGSVIGTYAGPGAIAIAAIQE
jgi:DegV family protein with EDD domain